MLRSVRSAAIIKQARYRAGLTQAALAERVGTTQSAIARLEAGATEPSLARVDLLVSACGGRLVIALEPRPPSREPEAADTLQERWDSAVRLANFVLDGRRAVADR